MKVVPLSPLPTSHFPLPSRMGRWTRGKDQGATLTETLLAFILLGILLALALVFLASFLAWVRLQLAAAELAYQWKYTRLSATGSGIRPYSLCMVESGQEQIQYAQVQGDDCERITHWQSLTVGVKIDTNNSTLRTVSGPAGNGGTIYRVSWADTQGGLGGSWGQLGRLVLIAPGTRHKKCLFLFAVDGSWNIREDRRCDR